MAGSNRLRKELTDALKSNDHELHLNIVGGDLYKWEAKITGSKDTPFEGGVFTILLRVPSDYPMVPPTATFQTKIFHPNIAFNSGEVCLDILKSRWSPAWTISSVCRAIINLLTDPEADSPLNCDAGNLVRAGDAKGYANMARMYAILEAGAPPIQW